MCKFTMYHLAHTVSTFATKVGEWQESRLLERTHSMQIIIQNLKHSLYVSEQNGKHLEFLRNLDAKVRIVIFEISRKIHCLFRFSRKELM